MDGVLKGFLVIDWTSWLNGAGAAAMFGDLGADVIKIEEPLRGDALRGLSAHYGQRGMLPGNRVVGFETVNRNKKGMTLNLKHDKGKEILHKLAARADVFITNYSEKLLKEVGADYPTLSAINPKLVYGLATGYGTYGPEVGNRSFDPIAQAYSGLMWSAGDRDSPDPTLMVGAIIDTAGSTMLAYGVLAALVGRSWSGRGQKVVSSLLGAAMHLQALSVNTTSWMGHPVLRHSRENAANPLSNYYRCADGNWIVLTEPQFNRFWTNFCETVGLDEKALEGASRKEINLRLKSLFESKPREDWLKLFVEKKAGFAYCPVQTVNEALEKAQVMENQYAVEIEHPTMGKKKTLGFPVQFSDSACSIRLSAPELGEHTEQVLLDLGYGWEQITELKDQGAI